MGPQVTQLQITVISDLDESQNLLVSRKDLGLLFIQPFLLKLQDTMQVSFTLKGNNFAFYQLLVTHNIMK